MDPLLVALCRRYARQISVGGILMLTHDGDPLLSALFARVGWKNQHHDVPDIPVVEAATVVAPERAVLPKPKGRIM